MNRYLPLAKYVAKSYSRGMPNGHGYKDDIFATAYLGLIDAVDDFDPKKGPFGPFAQKRIFGTIVDEARAFDRPRRNIDRIAKARKSVEQSFIKEHGRSPTDEELLSILGWSVRKLDRSRRKTLLLSEIIPRVEDQEKAGPFANTIPDRHDQAADAARKRLFDAITKGLTSRERQALHLYYFEGLNLQEVGERLGCCESRVCQLMQVALKWLRQARRQSEGELWEAARAAGIR